MTEGRVFDPNDAYDLLDMLAEWKASKRDKPARKSVDIQNGPSIYVRNEYAGTIPAFACMQVTGMVKVGDIQYLKVDRPADSSGAAGWYVFNGPRQITQSEPYGIAYDGPLCRMLTDGSTVTAGETWGPVSGQWTIGPGGSLFVAAGEDDIATNVMRGFFKGGVDSLVMKSPGGGIAARSGTTISSATCTVWERSGTTLSAGTRTETVYNLSTTAVAATVFIVAEWTNIGWVAVWEDC